MCAGVKTMYIVFTWHAYMYNITFQDIERSFQSKSKIGKLKSRKRSDKVISDKVIQ